MADEPRDLDEILTDYLDQKMTEQCAEFEGCVRNPGHTGRHVTADWNRDNKWGVGTSWEMATHHGGDWDRAEVNNPDIDIALAIIDNMVKMGRVREIRDLSYRLIRVYREVRHG